MLKLLPDAHIYDLIIACPGLTEACNALARSGDLELVSVAVVEDELDKAPRKKRELIDRVDRSRIGAGVFIMGYGRLGLDRLGPEEPYESVRGSVGSRHVEDAIVAATAAVENIAIVTHDRRLWKRASDAGIPVYNFPALKHVVDQLSEQ